MSHRPRSLPRDCAFFLLLAFVPAGLTGWLHPKKPAWSWTKPAVEQVELADVTRWSAPVLWVDAREESAYAIAHVPGAVLLNETGWERLLPGFLQAWRPGQRIVVYCNSERCNASDEVARRLKRELNPGDVFVLKGGWSAWQQNQR